MKAYVVDGKARLVEDYPKPTPGEAEALLRVDLAGICGTDLEITRGYMEFRGVCGHEFVGTVVSGARAGRRVVGEINCVCGGCDMCRAGMTSHCRRRTVLGIAGRDGAFAEYLALPEANLHFVPDEVSDEQAVFVEPLAAAFQVVKQVQFDEAWEVVVLGAGRLGQLVARVLSAAGVQPMVIGKHSAKLAVLENVSVRTCLLSDAQPAKTAHVVIECTGSAGGLAVAMEFVRPRGTIILKSTIADTSGMNLSPIVVDEITVVGSRCGPFPDALSALSKGEIDITGLVTATYNLDDADAAFEKAAEPESLKVLLKP
ncbi:MAG: alcohol dehydrogenase catalytic domain-containing protein [Planctomycetia bacterium]|nr:alcohol dehydrogenase catalytic domain-containing protein [Planctomycetia bacterium]